MAETNGKADLNPPESGEGRPEMAEPVHPDWLAGADLAAGPGLPAWLDMELPDFLRDQPPVPAAPDESAPPDPGETAPGQEPHSLSADAAGAEAEATDLPAPESAASAAPAEQEPPLPAPPVAAASEAPREPPVACEAPARPARPDKTVVYGFTARNSRSKAVHQVRVEHELPAGVRFLAAEPPGRVEGRTVIWDLGTWGAGAEQPFQIRVLAERGFRWPAGAKATFAIFQCLQTEVSLTRPNLTVNVQGPERVLAGHPALLLVCVANRGSGPATQVAVEARLPAEVHSPQGDSFPALLGTLEPGETRDVELPVTADRPGRYEAALTVTCAEKVQARGQAVLTATAPALEMKVTQPERCLLHQPVDFALELSNPGTAPATQVEVTSTLPEELELVAGEGGGVFDTETRVFTWSVRELPPGEKRTWSARLVARRPGDLNWTVTARADRGLEATATAALAAESPLDPRTGETCRALDDLLATIDGEVERAFAGHKPTERSKAAAAGDEQPYVIFTLLGTDYAVPIGNVVEMTRPLPATPVPNVPDWVLGVANFRGDIVSLVDFRLFLGLERPGALADQRLLVVRDRQENTTAGLLVDGVRGMRRLPPQRFRPAATPFQNRLAPYLGGVTDFEGRLLAVLDLDQLLTSPELRQFETDFH
jgi:uncharacterized repeat protein (TIGR01451 family)